VTSIERTAYPRFKRLPSARELHVFYTPQPGEVAWARGVAGSGEHLLALLVLAKCFGRLGYFPALADVPAVVFAGSILGLAYAGPQETRIAIMAGLAVAVVFGAWLVLGRHPDSSDDDPGPFPRWPARRNPGGQIRGTPAEASGNGSAPESAPARIPSPSQSSRGQESLLAGWPVKRLWFLGLAGSVIVAAIDAMLGNRVILIGLLIVGPCCVVLTGRWVPTALTGLWVISLAVMLGLPDGIWGTAIFFIWLGAVAVVALASTAAAAFIQTLGPVRLR
jgi:hypothetical protein